MDQFFEARAARLKADLEERIAVQCARQSQAANEDEEGKAASQQPTGEGKISRYWASESKTGPVFGGEFVPRESYNLLKDVKVLDLETATWWGVGHSWASNFGLTAADCENHGETPRVKCMMTQSTPPIVLMELNSLSTFNMLDPVLGADIQGMHQAINECLLQRSPQTKDYPLGYVLQGTGPHFCPGGNHHPVAPPGGTPFTMSGIITSWWNVQFREQAIPGITAITGAAVGGGIAIATNTTQRIAASNASMAFGNLSRGASPLMWLSKNLVSEVGLSEAVSLYLTDATVSAYGGLKAGLVMGVAPNIPLSKARAMTLSRAIASSPASRLLSLQVPDLNTERFAQEASGFFFNAKSGTMFANVSKSKDKAAAHETAAVVSTERSRGRRPDEREDDRRRAAAEPPGAAASSSSSGHAPEQDRSRRPRPFPDRIGAMPVHVSCCDTPCAQCGTRGSDGTIYGDAYYCELCWPRFGLQAVAASSSSSGGHGLEPGAGGGDAAPAGLLPPPQRTRNKCAACGNLSHSGQWGAGAYSSDFYCGRCWRRWRAAALGGIRDGAGFSTDVSTTDNDYDSGTDATIINSDCLSGASGSDVEWW